MAVKISRKKIPNKKNKLKKVYISKFSEVSGFQVWIVDGNYIRRNIDEEFTNFGQHYRFKFIPKNEFWIDKENTPGEERYYIDHMIIEYNIMSAEKSYDKSVYDKAVEEADRKEIKERRKSEFFKQTFGLKKFKDLKIIDKIHKKLLRKYSKKLNIWIVNGELVRDLFFIDFTEGGHDQVYSFIPKNEIWIDDDVLKKELRFVLLHEIHERNIMNSGWNYEKAHSDSSHIEYFCRFHPRKLDEFLKIELEKQEPFNLSASLNKK